MPPDLKLSFDSLSTTYFTAPESPTTPPLTPLARFGASFHTNYTSGTTINVAGDYHPTPDGPPVTYPPQRANYAPAVAMTRHFVGRDHELRKIRQAFNSSREGNQPVRYALCGEAGIGKSQLALRYADDAYAQKRYSHVFYLSAANADAIREGLALILRRVWPSNYVCAEIMEAQEALRWLEDVDPAIAWLLIVDRAGLELVDLLQAHLPRHNQRGDILFATQSHRVAEALAGERVLSIGPLAWDDAIQLLLRKAGVDECNDSIEEARPIVQQLHCLPIPIRQAASYAKYSRPRLECLTRLLQAGNITSVCLLLCPLLSSRHVLIEIPIKAFTLGYQTHRLRAQHLCKRSAPTMLSAVREPPSGSRAPKDVLASSALWHRPDYTGRRGLFITVSA
ncbi:hypothetical protein HWV62_14684 [Athelia sp. TMB]|nr:hypothetical protein HWV62_14684 [Athelia sp. TMB]